MDTANAALPAYVTVLLFFSGFLITWPKIPKYWIWMAYMDFMRYGWGALMINQFQGQNVRETVPTMLSVLCCTYHMCCAVLCCAVLAVLCCAVLCCAVLCCAVLCCAVLCCAVLLIPIQLHARHDSTSALHVQSLTTLMIDLVVSLGDEGLLNAEELALPTTF